MPPLPVADRFQAARAPAQAAFCKYLKGDSLMSETIVIVSATRTPMGSFQGDFTPLSANELGGVAIKAAVEKAGLQPQQVDEVIFGNVLTAGQGQAPARQAAIKAGLPISTGAVTLNKVCGSAMKAVMLAADAIKAGSASVVVAGGMESMTNAPYLLKKARGGYRLGHDKIYDHMMLDGLEDAYEEGCSMGLFDEDCAAKYNFTRQMQDDFALNPKNTFYFSFAYATKEPNRNDYKEYAENKKNGA